MPWLLARGGWGHPSSLSRPQLARKLFALQLPYDHRLPSRGLGHRRDVTPSPMSVGGDQPACASGPAAHL
eukprot:5686267-Alexandrium_andersonii.AAC.1